MHSDIECDPPTMVESQTRHGAVLAASKPLQVSKYTIVTPYYALWYRKKKERKEKCLFKLEAFDIIMSTYIS